MEPSGEERVAQRLLLVSHGEPDGLGCTHEHDEPLAAGQPRVQEVALKHLKVLRGHGHHNDGVLASLALVNRYRVGEHQLIELVALIDHRLVVDHDHQPSIDRIDPLDGPRISIEHAAIIVVADLHHPITDPIEALANLKACARRVQDRLKPFVEVLDPEEPHAHGREHLDLGPRVEAEAAGYSSGDELLHGREDRGRILAMDKVEVLDRGASRGHLGALATLNAVGHVDDGRAGALPIDLAESHNRDRLRANQLGQGHGQGGLVRGVRQGDLRLELQDAPGEA